MSGLWGDPLMEAGLTGLDLPTFGDPTDFMAGFGLVTLTPTQRIRRRLYSLSLVVTMIVETKFRGHADSEIYDASRRAGLPHGCPGPGSRRSAVTRRPRIGVEDLGSRPVGGLLWWTCSQTTLSVGVYGVYALTNAWFVARGVGETALATVGGQAVSAVMAVWFFFIQPKRPYRMGWRHLVPRLDVLRSIIGIGAPSFLAGLGATLLMVLVNASLAAVSAGLLAAWAVCSRVQTFASMPQTGIAQGLQPIVSYNMGSGAPHRVDRTRSLALRASLVYGAVVATVVVLAAEPIAQVFVTDPGVVAATAQALRLIAVGFAVAGIPPLVSAYFQAIGLPGPSYVISLGSLLVIKVPLVLLLGVLGPTGIWVALPLGEVLSAVGAWVLLSRSRRR